MFQASSSLKITFFIMPIFIFFGRKATKVPLFCALLFVLLHHQHAFSQGNKKGDAEVFELFDVSLEDLLNIGMVSASKKKQSVADAPATAYVFSQEQIKNRGYQNLSELLEDVPEIEIQRNANPEYRNFATVRGIAGNEKLLILLNGIRITPATGDPYAIGTNLSLCNAQRVEVILGPASALYGVDAFSGIVNIITRSQETKEYRGADITTSYGNFNTSNNSFAAGAKTGKLALSIAGNFHSSSEPNYSSTNPKQFIWYNTNTAPDGLVVESPFYQRISTLSSFERSAGGSYDGASLSRKFGMPSRSHFLNVDLSYGNFTVGYLRHYESHSSAYGLDPRFTLYDASAQMAQKQDVVYGKHTFISFNKKWGLQSTFTQSNYETSPESYYANASSRWQRGYVYSYGQSSKIEEQFNYDFNSKISLIAGLLYENLSALPRTGLSPKPFNKNQPGALQDVYFIGAAGYKPLASDEQAVFNDSLTVKQNFYYLSYQNYGGFLQLQITPWKVLEITLGTRYDYSTRFGETINPRAGLVFLPNKKFRLKVLYGEAYLAPSPKKAYQQDGSFYSYDPNSKLLVADYFRVANPNLKPEKLRQAEINTSYFINSNFSIGANGFYTQVENLINPLGTASDNLKPANTQISKLETSVNLGSSEVYGGTFKANMLNKLGKINFNWFASYSYIDGNINQDVLILTAKNTAKGGVEISHKRFALTPKVLYRSKSYSSLKMPMSNEYYSNDAYMVVHLYAHYLLIDNEQYKLRVRVKIDNLTNNTYYNAVFAGSDIGMGYAPQDPTRFSGGINLEF
jgi:outer membrane receptor for ferrienterochelin and colicin